MLVGCGLRYTHGWIGYFMASVLFSSPWNYILLEPLDIFVSFDKTFVCPRTVWLSLGETPSHWVEVDISVIPLPITLPYSAIPFWVEVDISVVPLPITLPYSAIPLWGEVDISVVPLPITLPYSAIPFWVEVDVSVVPLPITLPYSAIPFWVEVDISGSTSTHLVPTLQAEISIFCLNTFRQMCQAHAN